MKTTDTTRRGVGREEWAKRVERWRDSGLTAAEFATETGINARTLAYWKWALAREQKAVARCLRGRNARAGSADGSPKSEPSNEASPGFVEITGTPSARDGFELELRGSVRLRVPSDFDAAALRRLLQVLEAS